MNYPLPENKEDRQLALEELTAELNKRNDLKSVIKIEPLHYGNWFARLSFNREIISAKLVELWIKKFGKYDVAHPHSNPPNLAIDIAIAYNKPITGYIY